MRDQIGYFLCAHKRVMTTEDLLELLKNIDQGVDLVNKELEANEELRAEGVWIFIELWLEFSYYPDFVNYNGQRTENMALLHNFISKNYGTAERKERKDILMLKINDVKPFIQAQSVKPKSVRKIPDNMLDISLFDFTAAEVARGLTRLDAEMIRNIGRSELLVANLETLKKDQPNANYIKYAEHLKKLGLWMESSR